MASSHPLSVDLQNSAFLRELAGAAPAGCSLWVTAFVGSPNGIPADRWGGRPFDPAAPGDVDLWANRNSYYSVAALHPDESGELRRRKANFARLLVLVADDVSSDQLVGSPSYVLHTSPGKTQAGVLLDENDPDCADLALIDRLMHKMAERGMVGMDKAGNNAARYVRLPVGQNQKQRDSGPFACWLEQWSPAVRLTLEDAASVFGIDLNACRNEVRSEPSGQAFDGEQADKVRAATAAILRGENLHDSINVLAASMVSSGAAGGAAVNFIRGLMDQSAAPRDERFADRYTGIARAVSTAQDKFRKPIEINLIPRKGQPAATVNTDSDLDRLPVWQLQRACDWISGLYDQPTPAISVAGAIALASVVTGRLYRSEMANWPSLLMAIVGPSGIGKNYVKVGIERLLAHAGLDRLIAGDFYTHQSALYWALHQAPCHICISDEFGENFLEARKNNNANKMTVFKALKKVYSDADHIYKAESYSMGGLSKKQREELEQRPVINPAITMLGLSTARQFWSEIKASHIEGGLLNRFLIVTIGPERGPRLQRGADSPPEELIEHIKAVRRIDEPLRHTAYNLAPSWLNVEFSASARARFEAMRVQADTRGDKLEAQGLGPMTRRWRENAMRMATGFAAFDRPSSPIVTADIADWACRYVIRCGEESIEQLGANAGETDYAHQLNAVRGFIDGAGERGVTDYELKRGVRHIRRRDLAELIAHLSEAGAIVQVERKSDKGGRPSQAWVIAQVDE